SAGPTRALADAFHQQDLDYLDDHSYWDHPWFPNNPWDPVDWQIGNQSVLLDPDVSSITGILGGLAPSNKPYTISEYNHPFPNRFQSEMIPLLLAYGGFHDLDALMVYDYNGGLHNWDQEVVNGFFSVHRNTALMAQFPAAAYVFRKRLVSPESQPIEIGYSPDYVYQIPFEDDQGRWGKWLPYDSKLALTHSLKASTYAAQTPPDFSGLPAVGSNPYSTSTGETTLNTDEGWVKTATEQYCQFGGALDQAGIQHAGDVSLVQADGFGVVSLLALEDTSIRHSNTSLLTLISKSQNTNMTWNGTQSVGNNWGSSPIELAPLNVSLDLTMQADSIRIIWLDGAGVAQDSQTIAPFQANRFRLNIDQGQHPFFWAGIRQVGEGMSTDIDDNLAGQWQATLSPDQQFVKIWTPNQSPVPLREISLMDIQGRQIISWLPSRDRTQRFPLPPLASGLYVLHLHGRHQLQTVKFIVQ
ncbi:MAG: T9SS type A sorting domain-containing protein, partial [Bacteroidota bacterium]